VRAPVEYLIIGHVTHDVLPDQSYVIGGTVSYAALTAAALKRSVGMLTSAGADFDFGVFNGAITVACEPAPATTTFTNTYVNGHRHQRVHSLARLLDQGSVPEGWRSPEVAHIGPVISECDPSLVWSFPERTFIGVTPQGWMRSRDADGQVRSHPWRVEPSLLRRASAVVFSLDDVQGDWSEARRLAALTHLLVVTMGPRGGVVFLEGEPTPFRALQVVEVDPTGAGDIFAAAFFISLASGAVPTRAAAYAACLASRSVARPGPAAVPGPEDVAICSRLSG
jgi:sugar/nucleoside kinase (ribokinase family)